MANSADNTGTTAPIAQTTNTSTDNSSGATSTATPTVANPNGAAVDTTQSVNTNVVSPSVSGATGVGTMTTVASGGAATADDTATDNSINADNNITNTATSEVASQHGLTSELSNIDTSQKDTQIANATNNSAEFERIQNKQMAEKTQNELDYQKQLHANQDAEVSALQVQQSSEDAANKAAAAELKAKNDAAEYEMQTQNEIANQQSNIAFARLGLSFSGAAINTAQKIYTQGVYNLAKLKTTDAKNYADLQVKINSTAFDHIKQINSLIQQTTEKEFASKERLRTFIGAAQNNILSNKAQAQEKIQSAITTYKQEKQTREDKLYSDMNAANARLKSATDDIQKQVAMNQTNSKKKIDLLISNGQWNSLSPQQQSEAESRAGVPAGTTSNTIVAKTTQMLMENIKSIVGKNVSVPPTILAKMHTEVQRALKLNIPLVTATQMAIDKYSSKVPEISQAKQAKVAAAQLAAQKTQSEILKNTAMAQKAANDLSGKAAYAKATAPKVVTAKKSTGGSSGNSGLTYKNTQTIGGKDYDLFVDKAGNAVRKPVSADGSNTAGTTNVGTAKAGDPLLEHN